MHNEMDSGGCDEASDPLCGREVAGGRYLVERVLGKGGMGTVYAALQRPINRKVALKLIHRELTGNAEVVGRFMQEMRLTATIEHPHTVRLYDFGDIDGQPFLTTEFLQGRTLRAVLANAGTFDPQRLCNVGIQIAKALRAAHEHGVVHRDLKPDNVMLLDSYGERDYVKVLDFGIARSLGAPASALHTQTGMLLGTPAYMSPEQCQGLPVEARSDLYSLGLVLFELATGTPPFPREHTIPQLLMDHVSQRPPDVGLLVPGLAEPVARLIMALLEKDPEARPASAEVVVATLAPFVTVTTSPQLEQARTLPAPTPPPQTPRVPGVAPTQSRTEVLLEGKADSSPESTVSPPVPPTHAPPAVPPAVAAAVVPLPRRAQVIFVAAVVLVVLVGVGGWLFFRRPPAVAPGVIAAALSRPGEPAFPASCVSTRERQAILDAVTGRADWNSVAKDSTERLLVEGRMPDLAPEEARGKLEKVVAACPEFAPARTLLGKTLARLDQDDAAIAQFSHATRLAPEYQSARFGLAVALVKRSRNAEALPLLDAVLSVEPKHGGARLLRGQVRIAAGDKLGAVEDLRGYTSANPQAAAAWAMLGEALAQLGDRDAAGTAFCRAADLGVERVRDRCRR